MRSAHPSVRPRARPSSRPWARATRVCAGASSACRRCRRCSLADDAPFALPPAAARASPAAAPTEPAAKLARPVPSRPLRSSSSPDGPDVDPGRRTVDASPPAAVAAQRPAHERAPERNGPPAPAIVVVRPRPALDVSSSRHLPQPLYTSTVRRTDAAGPDLVCAARSSDLRGRVLGRERGSRPVDRTSPASSSSRPAQAGSCRR